MIVRMRWKGVVASIAGLLVAVAAIGWTWRIDVSRRAATWLLDRGGVGPVSLTVAAIDLGGLHARDISLFGGAVRVEALTLSYDPRQLVTGTLRQATVTRANVTLGMTEAGLEVGGMSLSGTGSGPSFLDQVRIDALRIVEGHILINTPTGPLEATVSTELAMVGTDISGSALSAEITVPTAGRTRIEAPTIALSLADGGVGLRFTGVAVRPSDLPWEMEGLDGTLSWQAGRLVRASFSPILQLLETPRLST